MEEQICQNTPIRTFIVMDLESTGLYNKPIRITELAMVAVMREHIQGYGSDISQHSLPRVLTKLNVCVYPRKVISQGATDVSGLSNELLEHQQPFDENLFNILACFIKRFPQPVCLVAHNGIKFDFPLLQQEIQKLGKEFPDHILCADSLLGFRELLNGRNLHLRQDKVQPSNSDTNEKTMIPRTQVPIIENKPSDNKHNDIFKDITPFTDVFSYETQNTFLYEEIDFISELEESELDSTDYDDALSDVLDTVELSPEHHLGISVDESDASALVERTNKSGKIANTIKLETLQVSNNNYHDLQKILEKTPESHAKKSLQNESYIPQRLLEHTPSTSTNQNICNGRNTAQNTTPVREKRNTEPLVNKARKRLNFSSEEEKNKPKSYRLGDIYRFLLKKEPVDCHRAENDSLILLECIAVMGNSFLEWSDNNNVKFNSFKKI
ncbi:hypothetical protein C0J52_16471 [Blattella germanica]|nr:hypothetical protein C0J52_16471 [Blattella germanica]